jgi:hypothetical protein
MSFQATAGASHEPTLHCPNCNHEIRLTESLAAPLLAETRQRFQQQLASKDAEMERKTEALRLEREQVVKDREQVEDQVAKRLIAERAQLVAAESKKAREAAAAELQAKESKAAELRATCGPELQKKARAKNQGDHRSRGAQGWRDRPDAGERRVAAGNLERLRRGG